jgi:hypothetical protein
MNQKFQFQSGGYLEYLISQLVGEILESFMT